MRGLLLSSALLAASVSAFAEGLSGNMAVEGRAFTQGSVPPGRVDNEWSLSAQPRWQWVLGRDDELTLELFARIDEGLGRQHGDIRELRWLHVDGDNEWRIGIDSVFWGVTESRHLVDVINSVDRLEGLDGEDKLGQPMIHYSRLTEDGVLEVFLLPGFRAAHYADTDARLTPSIPVRESLARYESSQEDRHVDGALRYSASMGDHDFGVSVFRGTQREPLLQASMLNGQPVLIPFYPLMTQWGLEWQAILGEWTWKIEAIRRIRDDGRFTAATSGFEYTFYDLGASGIDVGWLLEYSSDQRPEAVFDDDWFTGVRLAFNDAQSSEILAGLLYDARRGSQSLRVEASRRLGDSWKLSLEAQSFNHVAAGDPLKTLARDDYIQLELAWYF